MNSAADPAALIYFMKGTKMELIWKLFEVVVLAVVGGAVANAALFDDAKQCMRLYIQSSVFTVWWLAIKEFADNPDPSAWYLYGVVFLILCFLGARIEKKQFRANVFNRIGITKFSHKIKQSFRNIFLSIRDMRLPK